VGDAVEEKTSKNCSTARRTEFSHSMPFTNGIFHRKMASMKAISLDKAGRVVLPKELRDRLRLEAGDELLVEEADQQIVLRPVRTQATLKKERGVWVYQGGNDTKRLTESLQEQIDAVRDERIRELSK
jgi:AbrB family looped-hinge helix DNA binding protein